MDNSIVHGSIIVTDAVNFYVDNCYEVFIQFFS